MSIDKRTMILDASLDIIREEGLGAFTQPKVAKRADLRQSHLTYYFPTREDLLIAMADRVVTERISTIEAITRARTPSTKLRRLAEILTDPRQTRLLLALVQTADAIPDVATSFTRMAIGVAPPADDLLRAWEVEPTPAVRQLLQTASTGIAVLALANGGPAFTGTAEALLEQLITGFTTKESK